MNYSPALQTQLALCCGLLFEPEGSEFLFGMVLTTQKPSLLKVERDTLRYASVTDNVG